MSDDDLTVDNVVKLHLVEDADDAVIRTAPREEGVRRFCPHYRTELRVTAHRVFCRDCEEEVDAFEVLMVLTRNWERYADIAERARREADYETNRLGDLQRRIRNARATARRWEKKAGAGVAARLRADADELGRHLAESKKALAARLRIAAEHVEKNW